MNQITKNFKIIDKDFENFDQQLIQTFTFDNIEPKQLSGQISNYFSEFHILLNNNTNIFFFYKCFPYSSQKNILIIQINEKQIFIENDDEFFPNLLQNLKNIYLENIQ